MTDLTENLEALILENKLSKAHVEIKKLLANNQILTQKLFDLIKKVFELVSEKNILVITHLFKLSLESKVNIKEYLLKIINEISEKDFFYIYPIAKDYFISTGQLEEYEKVFDRYKSNLLASQSYTKLLLEFNEIESLGLGINLSDKDLATCHYGQGDISFFETAYKNALTTKKNTLLSSVNTDFSDPVWRKQSFVLKEMLLRNYGETSIENRKKFLKSIYELLLVGSEEKQCLDLLFNYAVDMGHKDMCEKILELLSRKYDVLNNTYKSKIKKMNSVTRANYEELDFADDLFTNDIAEKDLTIRRLVHQINILRDNKDLDGATKLLERLKAIDKEHTLVKELEEKVHKVSGSKVVQRTRTIKDIEQDLLNELSVYSKIPIEEELDDVPYLKTYTKKVVELMPLDVLEKQYRELIYSYNTFGFYENSLIIIERLLDEIELSLKEQISVVYLRSEVMRMAQNYYGALNSVEKSLEELALTKDEKTSFYYLKGEILRELGRRADALKAYATVYSLNKKYRMVAYRLKEVE